MVEESSEGTIDGGVELIEFTTAIIREDGVVSEWLEDTSGEWGVDAVEELQEEDADAHALWTQAVGLGLGYFEDQTLGTQFGQVIAQLTQAVRVGGHAEGFRGSLVQIAGAKTTAACEMDEAGQRLHDGQQARIVQLQAWCPTSARGDGGLPQACQLATIDIGLQHVLLDSQVAIVDAAHHSAQLGQVADRFADTEIASVVAGGFGARSEERR